MTQTEIRFLNGDFQMSLGIGSPHVTTASREQIQTEENLSISSAVESASFSIVPAPFVSKAEGKSKTPFVNAHYISAVIVPNESPLCGSFKQKIVTGLANWTWPGSPLSLIVSMTD